MPSPQHSAAELSSVVRIPPGMEPWKTIDGGRPLALFHAKFWGRSMATEEKERLNTQSAAGDIGSGRKGKKVDEKRRMGEVAAVKTDRGVADLDDDFIPGCYMLDIGIEGFPYPKIWIRADYIRIFDYLQVYYDGHGFKISPQLLLLPVNQGSVSSHRFMDYIITNRTPRKGKSVWVYYGLRRCLAESKPVIWYHDGACHLFVNEGVYKMPADYGIKGFIWTLVDSDESPEGIPSRLACLGTPHFPVYSTSRKESWSRQRSFEREVTSLLSDIHTYTLEYLSASLFPDRNFTDDSILDIFDALGPIPRLCLDYQHVPQQMIKYKQDLNAAIMEATPDKLERLVMAAKCYGMDSISDKICLICREEQNEVDSLPVVAIMTSSIQTRLATQLRNVPRDERLRRYHEAKDSASWE
ncbi:hypothetical protein M413DRAFT_29116 [Hebeloma cylindrosporum]|uniref:Uncharacterized protein n=1 Tax=Hebeloma cylindrosporum TaxID=76867 RepID=A0A0C2YFW5_HEBCY|nr:hypothetical protein M413DRAFT_29116 [Hebeloma cylindrosporum h7]